jgi:hypothetical protein
MKPWRQNDYFSKSSLPDDLDSSEIIQTDLCPSQPKILRFSLPVLHPLSIFPVFCHEDVGCQPTFELDTPKLKHIQ